MANRNSGDLWAPANHEGNSSRPTSRQRKRPRRNENEKMAPEKSKKKRWTKAERLNRIKDGGRPPSSEFTFQAPGSQNYPTPRFSQQPAAQPQHVLFSSSRPRNLPSHPKKYHLRDQRKFTGEDQPRPPHRNAQPYARPLLSGERAPTPEQLSGMNEEQPRFKSLADLSDSDEEDMQLESDREKDRENGEQAAGNSPKRMKRSTQQSNPSADQLHAELVASNWSNPDPYTSLPPLGKDQGKRKDMIKLIRKAKASASKSKMTESEGDDFIAFDNILNNAPKGPKAEIANTLDHERAPDYTSLSHNSLSQLGSPPLPSKEILDAIKSSSNKLQEHSKPHHNHDRNGPPTPPSDVLDSISGAIPGKYRTDVRSSDGSQTRNAISQHEKTIKGATSISKKRGRSSVDLGDVVDEWAPKPDKDTMPWSQIDHSETMDMGIRLHKEICDFYEYVRPRDFEESVRRDLVGRITDFVKQHYPRAKVYVFGSFSSGIYLPNADIDIVVISDTFLSGGPPTICQNRGQITKFARALQHAGFCTWEETMPITKARVPLVKFIDSVTRIRCDVSFENMSGVIANGTYQQWTVEYPALSHVLSLLKHFLVMRGLNEVHTGGLGGFALTCLVVCLFHHMPHLASGNMNPMHNLGEILMHFFDFYGNKFNTMTTGIQTNPPALFRKLGSSFFDPKNRQKLCIVDPNQPNNDVSSGSTEITLVFRKFSLAFEALQDKMNSLRQGRITKSATSMIGENAHVGKMDHSILGVILAGDYRPFDFQRGRLYQIYTKKDKRV